MSSKLIKALIPLQFVLFIVCLSKSSRALQESFYEKRCPGVNVLSVVKDEVTSEYKKDQTIAPALLRLHFHDCFVRGCDGSILLDSTKGNQAEKDAPPNTSLRKNAFALIDKIKGRLENLCPNVVSCADVLAFAAREGVMLTGGPLYNVVGGRTDGRISNATEATQNLPNPQSNFKALIDAFKNKGLTQQDMIALSGAHTIGQSNCTSFLNRVKTDPSMDKSSIVQLKNLCKKSPQKLVNMDNDTPNKFDTSYYNYVLEHKALFYSDNALLNNDVSRSRVKLYNGSLATWFTDFGDAMQRMGEILDKDKTNRGEIRKNCRKIN